MEVLNNDTSRRTVDAGCFVVLLTAFLCLVLNYVYLSSLATLIEIRRCIKHMEESEFFTCMDFKCAQSLVQEVIEGDSSTTLPS